MPILDRYLLRRYWHVFVIGYFGLFGLYFVIDAFTNVNDFIDETPDAAAMMLEMGRHYAYRACHFFGLIGGTLEVIAAMVALALTQKHGELNPILAAGISTFRLVQTLLVGAAMVNVLIVLNQELLIPQIALQLQVEPGQKSNNSRRVEPVKDHGNQLIIDGERLDLRERKLSNANFVFNAPVTEKLTTLKASEGFARRGGWLLKGTQLAYDDLPLTEAGKKLVLRGKSPGEIFVRSDVGIERLYNSDSHYEYLSTWELIRRMRNPSFSHRSIRSQSLFLHTRFTKPLMNLIVVAVGVPFVVRKESVSLVTNLAICGGVMGAMFGFNELCLYLGKVTLLSPELAVWTPIILWGSAAAWLTGLVRT